DFVGEQEIGEQRPAVQREGAGGKVQDVAADDVGGHQVGGALYAPEFQVKQLREAFDDQRLRNARYAFEQRVAAAKDRQQALIDEFFLAHDDFGQFSSSVSEHPGHCLHEKRSPVVRKK